MTDLNALLERVEGAGGPDRTLDVAIVNALELPVVQWHTGDNNPDDWKELIPGRSPHEAIIVPHYTASIDAALALAEKVLPGWCVLMAYNSTKSAAIADVHSEPLGTDGTWLGHARAQTLPLAILAALLRALSESSSSDKPGGRG